MPCTSTRSLTLTDWTSAAGEGSLSRPGFGYARARWGGDCTFGCWARRVPPPPCSRFRARRGPARPRSRRSASSPARPPRACASAKGSIANRVPTFDGVPIDANVTLPATRSRNLPLVIQLHGWAGSKSGLGSSKEWAEDGYAVLNYSARGFGDSCGSLASRTADPSGCARGWVHLAGLALRGARLPVPRRPAGRPGHRGAAQDRRDGRLVRRRPVADPRHPARPRSTQERQLRAVAQPGREADGDRRRRPDDPVVRPRALAHPERRHARHRGHGPDR